MGLLFRQVVQKQFSLVKRDGKLKSLLIAYFLSNMHAKSYQKVRVYAEIATRRRCDVFYHLDVVTV